MNKHLGFVCGIFLLVLMGCGQIDWSQWVATATPSVSGTPPPTPTVNLTSTGIPNIVPTGMVCNLEERPFLIECVTSSCNVRTGISALSETRVIYNVPRQTLLSAFGVCDCQDCVPFSQWYWLGEDINGLNLWAVADDHIWQRVEE